MGQKPGVAELSGKEVNGSEGKEQRGEIGVAPDDAQLAEQEPHQADIGGADTDRNVGQIHLQSPDLGYRYQENCRKGIEVNVGTSVGPGELGQPARRVGNPSAPFEEGNRQMEVVIEEHESSVIDRPVDEESEHGQTEGIESM